MAALDRYDEWESEVDALLASVEPGGAAEPVEDSAPSGAADPLADVYDPATLEAIDRAPGGSVRLGSMRGRAAAGAVMAGLAAGMREVFQPEQEAVVEEHRAPLPRLEPVSVHLVWGNPAASVAIVRRWLL